MECLRLTTVRPADWVDGSQRVANVGLGWLGATWHRLPVLFVSIYIYFRLAPFAQRFESASTNCEIAGGPWAA